MNTYKNTIIGDSDSESENIMSWCERMKLVYRYEYEKQLDLRPAVLEVYEGVQLSVGELIVLAWFVQNYGVVYDDDKLEADTRMTLSQLEEYKEKLILRGLLVSSEFALDVDLDYLERCFSGCSASSASPMSDEDVFVRLQSRTTDFRRDVIGAQDYVSDFLGLLKSTPDTSFAKGIDSIVQEREWEILSPDAKGMLFLLIMHFRERGTEPYDPSSESRPECGASGLRELIRRGYAEIVPETSVTDNRTDSYKDRTIISYRVAKAVFGGDEKLVDYARLCHQGEYLKADEISEKKLYYNEGDAAQIEMLGSVFGANRFAGIEERLHSRGRRSGVTCLLCGAPGTGKTELVRQLARKSGRDLIIADAARMNGGLWGDAERNVRELFRNFRYVYAISSNAPILLLNEADGILGKRTEGKSAVERSDSVVQTIFLQELERFEGILIATTNLENLLDPAFERRFLFKISVHAPEPVVMHKIWRSLIPELTDEQAETLSRKFQLSGGMIENVAMKWDIFYSLNGEFPDWAKLMEFCTTEQQIQRNSRVVVRGF